MSVSTFPESSRLARAITIAVLIVTATVPATALAQGRIIGTVRDTTGVGVAGAQITVPGTSLTAESNVDGAFTLAAVPPGPTTLRVRRLGFAPASTNVVVPGSGTTPVAITVVEVARELTPVVVRRLPHRRYTGRLAGFYERRDLGMGGHFITGEEIDRTSPMRLTDVLRTVPGVSVASAALGETHVRMRGNRCWPAVWIDGAPAVAAEFDLDALVPSSVAGIEIYAGPATVPAEFVVPFGPTACGTILIWSRTGDPRERETKTITAAQLADLVTSLRVYTADQVDTPARTDSAAPITPVYPDSLYRERVPGRTVVEFVVDTAGRADLSTLGVVSSTNPQFTVAVRRALPDARFTPARKDGRPVPQVVRQSFAFVVPQSAAPARP